MTNCVNCGAPVEGRFCPKCGAAVAAAPTTGGSGYVPPAPGSSSSVPPGYVPPAYVPPPGYVPPGNVPPAYVPPGASAGSAPPGYVPPGYPAPPAAGLGVEENLASALCYIPIVGLIFLLIEPYNKNKTVRFHAFQSIFYFIAWIVAGIALGILFGIMFTILPYGVWSIMHLLSRLVQLAFVIGWIFMAVKAYQRDRFVMPIIGPLAAKQA